MKADFLNTTVEGLFSLIDKNDSVTISGNNHIDTKVKLTKDGESVTVKAIEGEHGPTLEITEWESNEGKYSSE